MHLYVLQKTIWVKNGLKDGVCACVLQGIYKGVGVVRKKTQNYHPKRHWRP